MTTRAMARAAAARPFGMGLMACAAAGLPIGLDIELIGRITGTELVLLAMLPVLLLRDRMPPLTGPMRMLLVLALVWLVAQFSSDIVNATAPDDMARGAARAGITSVLLLGFFSLAGNRLRNLRALHVALAMGFLIGAYISPSEYIETDAWKFGYGNGAIMLTVAFGALLWAWGLRSAAIVVCVLMGMLNLFLGYRSMAGIVTMTALLLVLSRLFGGRGRATSVPQVVMIFVVLGIAGAGLIELYAQAAQSGLLGYEAQEKFERQVDERGVLLSGRAEFPVALEAALERPLLGHGSWAVNESYAARMWELSGIGLEDIPFSASDLIPTHSHLMGAWVEGGIFSALLWLYVIVLVVRAIIVVVRDASVADPIMVFTVMCLLWTVLFSPYGLTNRAFSCFGIVVVVTVLRLGAHDGSPASAHLAAPRSRP